MLKYPFVYCFVTFRTFVQLNLFISYYCCDLKNTGLIVVCEVAYKYKKKEKRNLLGEI